MNRILTVMENKSATFGGETGTDLTAEVSYCGVIDANGNYICPDAYKYCDMEKFIKSGWVDTDHNRTYREAVGMVLSASFDGTVLKSTCRFHEDPESAAFQQRIQERIDAGKSVAVSVQAMPDYNGFCQWFPNGESMAAYLEDRGFDLNKAPMSPSELRKHNDYVRCVERMESIWSWAICPMGANPFTFAVASQYEKDVKDAEMLLAATARVKLGDVKPEAPAVATWEDGEMEAYLAKMEATSRFLNANK